MPTARRRLSAAERRLGVALERGRVEEAFGIYQGGYVCYPTCSHRVMKVEYYSIMSTPTRSINNKEGR